jgi:hypothetical protein
MIQNSLQKNKQINLYMATTIAVWIFITGLYVYWVIGYTSFIEKTGRFLI